MKLQLLPVLTLCVALSGCAFLKTSARTVSDAAHIACEVAFGADEMPAGVSLEDFCRAEENLKPFIDNILSAKMGVQAGMSMGGAGPE